MDAGPPTLNGIALREAAVTPKDAAGAGQPTALVLDGGGAQSVVLVRILGRLGWKVLCESGTRAARSRWTAATVELPPLYGASTEPSDYVQRLREICGHWNVRLVAPASDLLLAICWQAAREDDTIVGARILGADRRSADTFIDKAAGVAAARDNGFEVPETSVGADAAEVVVATSRLGYPCVVKPRLSFQRIGGVMRHLRHVVVSDRVEAQAAVKALTGDDGLLPVAQRYVSGRALSVTAVIQRRRVVAYSARETLSFFPIGGGTSVWKRTIAPTTPGVQDALALMCRWGLEGIAEVEYLLTPAGPRFMELGPRIHGWIPLAEASLPGLLAAAIGVALDADVAALPPYRPNLEMRWIGGELRRLRTALGGSRGSLGAVLRSLWPPWRPGMLYDGVDLSDLAPLVPGVFLYRSAAWMGSVARAAENDAPLTNLQNGPKVPSAG